MVVETNQKYGRESFILVFKEISVLFQLFLDENQLCDNSLLNFCNYLNYRMNKMFCENKGVQIN